MSSELLRQAAARMRERAEAATPGPWEAAEGASGNWWVELRNTADVALDVRCENATHIASWHPAVALAVADWLQKSAETYERLEDDLRGLEGAPTIEQVYGYDFTEALAVARAYLGRDS